MKRFSTEPRANWRKRVEEQGLLFHCVDALGAPSAEYWAEGTYYALTPCEIDVIEAATSELHALCLEAAAHVIARKRYAELGIPDFAIPWIERSFFSEEPVPSIYGRMDLAFGPDGVPKLLEYNADTPTSLLEGAVIQWTWLTEQFPALDQYNSIHEKLIDVWRDYAPCFGGDPVYFGHVDSVEDEMTIGYLRDTATQAGLVTEGTRMEDLGWDPGLARFVALDGRAVRNLFKLYPWEGLYEDEFAPLIGQARGMQWIEPPWKMLLSTKGILPILWELFPGHPNLLPASRERMEGSFVRKPLRGREGNNIVVVGPGISVETAGPYAEESFVYQAYTDLGEHDGMRPVIGSWIIGEEPAGMGIRETRGHVTDNTACFVPHVVV